MALFDGSLSSVIEDDLLALVANQTAESRVLDYKRDAIGGADLDRREFLADVASFANAAGGHLVLGMEESGGLASSLVGCTITDPDAEILRLEQMMRTGIRPVVQGIETAAIRLVTGRSAIVIRIPRSWRAPHQVGPVGSYRIFGRGSNGKYQLDVDELRTLFQQGPELAERVRTFRQERLLRILSNDTPVALAEGARIILHLVPIGPFMTRAPVRLDAISGHANALSALLESGGSTRINIDGRLAAASARDGQSSAYAQLWRDGSLEIVERWSPWPVDDAIYLPGLSFDENVQRVFDAMRRLYAGLMVEPPISVLLTLTGMRGWRMGAGNRFRFGDRPCFDRDPLLCPDVLLESLDGDVTDIARPLLDLAWNAAGFPQSQNYDQQGQWAPRLH